MKRIRAWIRLKTHLIEGRSYFGLDDLIAILLLLLGVLGFISGPVPYIPILTDFYIGLRSEMVGIGITVLILANANDWMNRRAEKDRLILQMGSPDHTVAVEAVRQLRSRGWLEDGSLIGAYLFLANLSRADLRWTQLSRTNLQNANLSRASLFGADLRDAEMSAANLENAKLNVANLSRAQLSWGKLNRADLNGAKLEYVSLLDASLINANLSGANLYRVYLRGANLRGANLSGVNLSGADLYRVYLRGAKYDKNTIWPDGFDPELEGAILV